MKFTHKIFAGAATTALALVIAGGVYAQPGGPGWMMGPGWTGAAAPGGWGMQGGPGRMMGGAGGPGWMGGPGAGFGRMGWGMHGGLSASDTAAVTTNRLAEFKAELKIAASQDTAWKAYEAAVQQQAGAMQAMHAQMQTLWQTQPGSADFAAQRDAMFKLRDSSWAAYNTAAKNLYAALTPEQRAIADRRGLGFVR